MSNILEETKFILNKYNIKANKSLGQNFLINDNVGVLYDCRDDGVNITFYRNKKNLGIAFKNLPKDLVYYPTVEMGLCGSKIQISNDIDFPDDK